MDRTLMAEYTIGPPDAAPASVPPAKYSVGPESDKGEKFEPVGETPFDKTMRGVARTVVPAVANFVDYPARAIAADVYGVTHGAIPVGEEGRKKFYEARDKSLQATKIPETKGGEAISEVLSVPGQLVGGGVKAASEAVLGKEITKALGPIAAIAGDVAPVGMAARGAMKGGAPNLHQQVKEATDAGYVLTPAYVSDKPGLIPRAFSAWAGKLTTQQHFSVKNQEVTNRLAAEGLGLPSNTVLNEQVFSNIRKAAGQKYEAVANSIPMIAADATYDTAISGLGGKNSQAAQMFPKITKNQAINDLVDELKAVPQMPTGVAVELVKELRFNANSNFKAIGDPSKVALGMAQREAAHAIDDLIERNVSAAGHPDLVAEYRQARQMIAKSYDVEGATNFATGDVSARHLAGLAAKGRPLTGQLDQIARAGASFPKVMQSPSAFGYDQPWSALDFIASVGAASVGNYEAALTFLGRPAARSALATKPMQRYMTQPTSPILRGAIGGELIQPHDDANGALSKLMGY